MRNNLIKTKRNVFASTTIISILSFAAVLAILASVSVSSAAYGGSPGAVYIIDNSATGNNVWVYARASDGSLTSLGSVSAGGLGTGTGLASEGAVVLTANGRWLLTVDSGSNLISVFKVHGTTLTLVSTSSSEGSDPISLTTNGNLVYVLDAAGAGNIAGFTLSQWGTLSFISRSVQPLSGQASPSPEQIGFNNNGNILVVTEKGTGTIGTSIIDTYGVNRDGVASAPDSQTSSGIGPYGFAFNRHDELVVSEAASDTVSSYYVSNQGKLTVISAEVPTGGNAPCWVAISGDLAFAANAHGGTISSFHVANRGELTLISSTAATTAIPALDMAFSHNSQFLYVHNGASITGYAVSPDGTISSIGSVSGLAASASGLAAS